MYIPRGACVKVCQRCWRTQNDLIIRLHWFPRCKAGWCENKRLRDRALLTWPVVKVENPLVGRRRSYAKWQFGRLLRIRSDGAPGHLRFVPAPRWPRVLNHSKVVSQCDIWCLLGWEGEGESHIRFLLMGRWSCVLVSVVRCLGVVGSSFSLSYKNLWIHWPVSNFDFIIFGTTRLLCALL